MQTLRHEPSGINTADPVTVCEVSPDRDDGCESLPPRQSPELARPRWMLELPRQQFLDACRRTDPARREAQQAVYRALDDAGMIPVCHTDGSITFSVDHCFWRLERDDSWPALQEDYDV
jgi:hypothetical protein